MNIGVISVRYARALLEYAISEGMEARVGQEMENLANAYVEIPGLRCTMDNPMMPLKQKIELLHIAVGEAPSRVTANFIKLVLQEERQDILQFMANAYLTLYREKRNIIQGKLTTATAISEEIVQKIRTLVETESHSTVEFKAQTSPDIIGGFVLEYGTYRMDASVRRQLDRIFQGMK